MKLIEILKPDFFFEDDRGTITQIAHEGFHQINAVFTKKGAVRGNFHYHKFNKEAFYIISGKTEVRAEKDGKEEKYIFSSGDMFMINEGVKHDFTYLEDTYLVGLYSGSVELSDGTKDIFTE